MGYTGPSSLETPRQTSILWANKFICAKKRKKKWGGQCVPIHVLFNSVHAKQRKKNEVSLRQKQFSMKRCNRCIDLCICHNFSSPTKHQLCNLFETKRKQNAVPM